MREAARELAVTPAPEDPDVCLAGVEELLFAQDRITCAVAEWVGRVHRAGQAKQHGHASTRSWLRTSAGMTTAGAGRLLTLAVELARLPRVREAFAAGHLAAGVVEAICTAISGLTDEQARLAEPILLELAGKAGPAEVAKAGRYLRAVLDPDGEERDEQADYGRRFLRVRPGAGGGVEGEFYLPREAAARLRALLDAYAKPKAEGDDRPLRVRYADAFIALLEDKIVTELLVLVSAESLPADPEPANPARDPEADRPESTGHPEGERPDSTDRPEAGHPATDHSESTGHPATGPATQHPEAERPESTDHPGSDAAAGNPGSADRLGTRHPVSDHSPAVGQSQGAEGALDARAAEDTVDRRDGEDVSAPGSVGSCAEPSEAVDTGGSALSEADDTIHPAWDTAGNPGSASRPAAEDHPGPADNFATDAATGNPGSADRHETRHPATVHPEAGHTGSVDRFATPEAGRADSGEEWEDAQNAGVIEDIEAAENIGDGLGREAAREGRRAVVPADDVEDLAPSRLPRTRHVPLRVPLRRSCDPPGDTCAHHAPRDACARHTHAGPRPAGAIPHGPGHAARPSSTPKAEPKGSPAPGPEASTQSGPGDPAEEPSGTASRPGSSAGMGTASGAASDAGVGTASGTRLGSRMGAVFESAPGAGLGMAPGAEPGSPFRSVLGSAAGLGVEVVPGLVPGLLLATGQVLPVSSVHRLARTSTLVRIVMDADGQVLDMGRKVRLATPAQRRAIFARYATCWVDGCPPPGDPVPDRPRRQLEHRRTHRPQTARPGLPVPQPRPLPPPRALHPPQSRQRPLGLHLPPPRQRPATMSHAEGRLT
ncbi:hypothetical protein GCM10010116_57460 [Microbispora rosea subsp. aerata]|nr:DUF222 domain-containing protein [Microbispora rosea]GGO28653.1 hypothetical protein GCM10010116_57460 [Microbispora rosea subsp. aerata]